MEEAAKKRTRHNTKDIGIWEAQIQLPQKTSTESYYTGAKSVSGLHDLLSCHHRSNGERIQVLVGDTSQVEGGEGRLG